jgi:hypothetical protein
VFHNERLERNVEELTDAEIYAAIDDLDPSLDHSGEQDDIASYYSPLSSTFSD